MKYYGTGHDSWVESFNLYESLITKPFNLCSKTHVNFCVSVICPSGKGVSRRFWLSVTLIPIILVNESFIPSLSEANRRSVLLVATKCLATETQVLGTIH